MFSKKLASTLTMSALALTLVGCSSGTTTTESSSSMASESTSMVSESSEMDVVTTASISGDVMVLETALGSEGNWLIATTEDVMFDKDVMVSGTFYNKDDESQDIYRKLALYAQDEDRNVTAEYKMTVPQLMVESENFNIVNGTLDGDIMVKANGFVLNGTTVTGDIMFETQEFQDSANLEENGAVVEGTVSVK